MPHRVEELNARPVPDAGFRIGRDVGRVNRAERRCEGQASRHQFAIWRRMASCTVSGNGQVATALNGRLISNRKIRAGRRILRMIRLRQQPCCREQRHKQDENQETAQGF